MTPYPDIMLCGFSCQWIKHSISPQLLMLNEALPEGKVNPFQECMSSHSPFLYDWSDLLIKQWCPIRGSAFISVADRFDICSHDNYISFGKLGSMLVQEVYDSLNTDGMAILQNPWELHFDFPTEACYTLSKTPFSTTVFSIQQHLLWPRKQGCLHCDLN